MQRLSVFKKRADYGIQLCKLFFCQIETGTGFTSYILVFFLSIAGIIEMLFKGTFLPFATSVTYIGWLFKKRTFLFFIIRTKFKTLTACAAFVLLFT